MAFFGGGGGGVFHFNKVACLTFDQTVQTLNDLKERGLLKTFWEKEKMLVTSIFSISQNVFYLS